MWTPSEAPRDEQEGQPVVPTASAATRRLSCLVVVVPGALSLFLAMLAVWWAEDVVAPFINDGEATLAETVTFNATADRYRVVTSGALRPQLESIACSVESSDGTTKKVLGGQGRVASHDRLGVSRVLEFSAQAGPTHVRCIDRRIPTNQNGQFHIVPVSILTQAMIVAAFVAVAIALSVASRLKHNA
jgi:hypothetical protein